MTAEPCDVHWMADGHDLLQPKPESHQHVLIFKLHHYPLIAGVASARDLPYLE